MKLFVDEKEYVFSDDREGVRRLLAEVERYMDESPKIVGGYRVDGAEVYEELDLYLEDLSTTPERVEVIALTPKEYVTDVLLSSHDYMLRGQDEVEGLARRFYTKPSEDEYEALADLTEGLVWILETVRLLDANPPLLETLSNRELWNEHAAAAMRLQEVVEKLVQATERRDTVLIADLLTYEIVPVFEDLTDSSLELLK